MEETEGVFGGHKVRKPDLYSVAKQLSATVCSSGALAAGRCVSSVTRQHCTKDGPDN